MDISFSAKAFCKMLMHAAKYPHCAVNGILLAKQKNKDNDKPSLVQIVDSVPLFHICLHVSPMSEIALTTIEQMASSQGLVIAGYYLANENVNDLSADKPAHRSISEKIAELYNKNAVLAVIDNKKLIRDMTYFPLKVSQCYEGKWKVKDKLSIHYEGGGAALEMMYDLLVGEVYRDLVDFDNHLDNIALDWRNLELNDVIADLLEKYRL